MAYIEAENAKGHSYTLGTGPFTDQTNEEWAATFSPFNLSSVPRSEVVFLPEDALTSLSEQQVSVSELCGAFLR